MTTHYNVNYIEQGKDFGYFCGVQFNDFTHADASERRDEAMAKAEEIAATGKPVVVKELLHGTRCNSIIWQSLNSADQRGLMKR